MKIVVANSLGRLSTGESLVLFPSRWDAAMKGCKDFAYYPYELAYLSTLLKRELPASDVVMVDGNLPIPDRPDVGWNAVEYANYLKSLNPDYLITECSALTYTAMTECCIEVAEDCGSLLILTGPAARSAPKKCLQQGWDHAVGGEYESKVLSILSPTHAYDGSLVDLDWLPWPEDRDIERINYWERSNPTGNGPGMIQMYPTRGCPLSCTFCVVPSYYGGHGSPNARNSHRVRSIDDCMEEIKYLAARYGYRFKGCFFNEETHNANRDWFAAFCRELIKSELNEYVYDAMCGYWPFDRELVALAAKAGYRQLRVGVENLSERSGKAIKKNVNQARLEDFLRWCKDEGIRAYGTFQIGAQGSSREEDEYTVERIKQWTADGLMPVWQCSISTPQPGTPFYDEARARGWLTTTNHSRYNGMEPVVNYPDYPADQIAEVFASVWS